MNYTHKNINNIHNIKTLLTQLDNTFYNTIDTGLIQHPDLCSFAFNMENIIKSIKHSLEQLEHSSPITLLNNYDNNNIDYTQLQALFTKNIQ
jgi:hypothetical protein